MSAEADTTSTSSSKKYEDFLLTEYNNIAQAHFNTVSSISTFFRHYLLIVSLPVPLLALVGGRWPERTASLLDKYAIVPPAFGTLIALVGLCVMAYVGNLRFDALLYARTVNGIRKYFARHSGLPFEEESRFRVLPRSTYVPRYAEPRFFGFVIVAFALLDGAYAFAGWYWYARQACWAGFWSSTAWVVGAVVLGGHLGTYYALAKYREGHYLRSHIIGVDIDGVLNQHRQHFCELLRELTGKDVKPDTISKIPVHECESLAVTEEDEHAVFNEVRYWRDMPIQDGAADILKRLRNVFGYKIVVFSYRPWPHPRTFPDERKNHLEADWRAVHRRWRKQPKAIRRITTEWLQRHGVVHNRLIIEQGNIHTTDPGVRTNNRFIISQRKNIRIFVEDDLLKARKLADICELVFLIRQPYNRRGYPEGEELPEDWRDRGDPDVPNNVIAVDSWRDIYRYIREKL